MAIRNPHAWARGLGWFSIALGLTETVAAKPLARALGIRNPTLLRDLAVLGRALSVWNPKRRIAAFAIAAVAPVLAADLACGIGAPTSSWGRLSRTRRLGVYA